LSWLRCDSFEVIEELPSWRVFGPHGAAVAGLIAEAEDLSQAAVDTIASMDGEKEWQIRLAFLDRWRKQQPAGPELNEPAGWGGLHVSYAVDLAAARTGQHLFGWIEEAGYWPKLADPLWRNAQLAAQAKMTALSAPELLEDHEMDVLAARWDAGQGR
jgi:hypothetical protein